MVHDLESLSRVVAFLVSIMVVAQACADEGLFEVLGRHVNRLAKGSSPRLLAWSIGLAVVVTVALSLDATVVLLTPVLIASSAAHRSHAYASVRIANSGSTLLPVSNLTNLLAFGSSGLTFIGFAWAMLPVWLFAVAAEYAVLRWWFRGELREPNASPTGIPAALPLFPCAVVLVVLMSLASGTTPWVPASAGAMLLSGYALVRHTTTWRRLLNAANLPLAGFVLLWGLAVSWLGSTAVGNWFGNEIPDGAGLGALLSTALIAMAVANIVNNLPATLLLLPATAAAGPAAVLAMLVGVNVGANLTVIGSLANLLWRQSGGRTLSSLREFHLIGLATTPAIVVGCTTVLWAWTSLIW